MTSRKQTLIAVAATALLVPSLLFAGKAASHFHHRGMHEHFARIAQKLDLTAEQRQQIHQVFQDHRTELTTELDQLKTARTRMFETIHGDKVQEAAIRDAAQAVGQAEADLAVTRSQMLNEIRPLLTAEQRAKAHEMLSHAKDFVEGCAGRFQEELSQEH